MNNSIQTLGLQDFPELLREITDPPQKLFIRGELPDPEAKYLCVVGSRRYSSYGKDACEHLISSLRGHNIVIVSGLAIGIDAIAHRAALKAGLLTIAIPGSGLAWEVLYPRAHISLARQILEAGGTLVSEFEENFKATPWSFPQRNRLMAGMSSAVLIVEAEEKSGTLITARLATDYNRDVCVVPGSIFSQNARGPNELLRHGATPITSSSDLLEALGLDEKDKSEKDFLKNLSPDERQVVEILREPLQRDELIQKLRLPTNKVNILLSTMEIKGIVTEQLGLIRVK